MKTIFNLFSTAGLISSVITFFTVTDRSFLNLFLIAYLTGLFIFVLYFINNNAKK